MRHSLVYNTISIHKTLDEYLTSTYIFTLHLSGVYVGNIESINNDIKWKSIFHKFLKGFKFLKQTNKQTHTGEDYVNRKGLHSFCSKKIETKPKSLTFPLLVTPHIFTCIFGKS